MELLGVTQVGKRIGWTRQKVSVYVARGKLPEPYATVEGKRPLWTKEQIDAWVRSEGDSDNNAK